MNKYLQLTLVAFASSLCSFFLFYQFGPVPQVRWVKDESGAARYAGLVDRLFQARSNSDFVSAAPTSFTDAADIATPAVVNIRALQQTGGGIWSRSAPSGSSGSGVILSPDGYVVTNRHVVENSTEIRVTLADKRSFYAELIGADPSTDIALLKIDEVGLPFLLFGNSDSVRVGEWVLAVGNPFNLESTVTAGIVSAKGRNINILGGGASIESFIQTDAAVNPGNSGGALVNTAGELIGINTAIITETGSYEGYSFAVPSNLVQKIIRDLREFGRVQRAFLGVGIEDLDSETARTVGLPNAEGVYINRITPGSAAADAGLQSGDVIISVNNVRVRSTPELQEYIGRLRPGDKINLDYWRRGAKQRASLLLKDARNSTSIARLQGDELRSALGFELRDLNGEEERRMGLNGALVTAIQRGSMVYATNMQPGFVVISVNGKRVTSAAETIEAIRDAVNSVILDGYYEGEEDLYSYRFRKRE
jgi:Do/DeqQ family serine protease